MTRQSLVHLLLHHLFGSSIMRPGNFSPVLFRYTFRLLSNGIFPFGPLIIDLPFMPSAQGGLTSSRGLAKHVFPAMAMAGLGPLWPAISLASFSDHLHFHHASPRPRPRSPPRSLRNCFSCLPASRQCPNLPNRQHHLQPSPYDPFRLLLCLWHSLQ
jgi:hypothetical protein